MTNAMTRGSLPEGGTGFVGPDIPVDLLLATGRSFGHLPWHDGETPFADRWLESAFPFWARSIIEQWHEGRFDGVAQVLFSRTDDVSQRLYYYVRELQKREKLRGPEPIVLDAALIPRESSLAYTLQALRDCASALGVASAALAPAIRRANALRSRLAVIQRARRGDGPAYEQLARESLFSDPTHWLDSFAVPVGAARCGVLLAGSFPPDDRLHRAAEEGGASIVAELHVHHLLRLGPPVQIVDGDALPAIAAHLVKHSIGPRSFVDRSALLLEATRTAGVRGVILWQTREEEGLAWHIPAQRRVLEAAGVPSLVMAARQWRADDGAIEAIRKFCQELSR